jgi:hypothetical protein
MLKIDDSLYFNRMMTKYPASSIVTTSPGSVAIILDVVEMETGDFPAHFLQAQGFIAWRFF